MRYGNSLLSKFRTEGPTGSPAKWQTRAISIECPPAASGPVADSRDRVADRLKRERKMTLGPSKPESSTRHGNRAEILSTCKGDSPVIVESLCSPGVRRSLRPLQAYRSAIIAVAVHPASLNPITIMDSWSN